MLYADSLGFLGLPGEPIQVDPGLRLDLVHLTSVPPWAKTMDEALEAHRDFLLQVGNQPRLEIIRSDALYWHKTAVILGMQHVPDDIKVADIKKFHQAGIRVMGIAYDEKNSFGSGWKNQDDGLTKEGKKFLEALAENRMILDLSHAGHQTARDALHFIRKHLTGLPVFASHSGCYEIYQHPRNLPTTLLQEIAEMKGVVGIPLMTFLLDAEDNGPKAFINHIRYALQKLPSNSVCVGSDAPYVVVSEEESRKNFEKKKPKLDPDGKMRARWPEYVEGLTGPDMMEKIETEIRFATPLESKDGSFVGPDRLAGILGGNLVRFFKRSLG